MIHKNLGILSLILSASVLSQTAFATAAQSTVEAVSISTPVYSSGITADASGSEITKTLKLLYSTNTVEDCYSVNNSSSSDIKYTIAVPEITFLNSEADSMYSFSVKDSSGNAIEYDEESFFSPVFSAAGLNETSFDMASLLSGQASDSEIPETEGTLYEITPDGSDSFLTLSDLSDSCHIYPLGCIYSASEGTYSFSASEGFDTCYVFLTGTENTDFTVTYPEGIKHTDEASNMRDFFSFCCSWFIENRTVSDNVTKDLLMADLADYFSRSSVVVSLDLISTLDWIITQKMFRVYSCSFTLAAGETALASVSREINISPSETVIYPMLAKSSLDYLTGDYIYAQLPEGYSSIAVRDTSSSKVKSEEGLYQINKYKEDTYSVALFKTPVWQKTTRYLPVFCVIMAVFMALCFLSYFTGRNKSSDVKK